MTTIGKQAQSRMTWAISPITRVKDSKKKYDRKKNKQETKSLIRDHKE